MAKGKIKSNNQKVNLCNKCFNPQYIKFNFTYFKTDNKFNGHEAQLLKRMIQISSENYVVILERDKKIGFEFEKVDINKKIPSGFLERFPSEANSKLTIMRLYPNNNPIMARVVGITRKNIFYLFYVFFGEDGYKR